MSATVEKTTKKLLGGVTGKGFVPGKSGNPNGRPKGSVSVVEGIRRKLLESPDGQKRTYLDIFLERYFNQAIKKGDAQILKDIINRVDGMPTQSHELTGKDGEDFAVILKIPHERS